MRRIERLINLIAALLETGRPMTAEEIRQKIAGYDRTSHEAFRRTFERDKAELKAMGIPIELRNLDPLDDAEGYIIPKAMYYLPQLDLEPDEVAALSLAADTILGAGEEAQAGLMKLSLDAPSSVRTGPRVIWGADVAAQQPALTTLYSALLERKSVAFDYHSAGAEVASERQVDAYALVHRRGQWYVVGHDHGRGEIRTFKVSRVRGPVRVLQTSYEIPERFDADEHVAGEAWEIGSESAKAIVRFSERIRWWAQQNHADAPRAEAPGGALDVELEVGNLDALVSWALGFGPDVEIIEPDSARRAMLAHLESVLRIS